jgi:hypothetical protein
MAVLGVPHHLPQRDKGLIFNSLQLLVPQSAPARRPPWAGSNRKQKLIQLEPIKLFKRFAGSAIFSAHGPSSTLFSSKGKGRSRGHFIF